MFAKLIAALLTGILSIGAIVPQLLPSQNPAIPTSEPAVTQAELTAEEAQAIALAHAGFTAQEVQRLYTKIDRDDGIPHWDVEFHQGDWEFDYEIHAQTGKILSFDKDFDD